MAKSMSEENFETARNGRLGAIGEEFRDETAGPAREVGDDVAELRRDIAKLAETVQGLVSRNAESLTGEVKARAEQATRMAKDGAAVVTDEMERYYGQASEVVQRNPMASLFTAVAVGFFLGMMGRK
jgi:ElaB/YqjD/DUF883 family membrane-anchored ribosome-binding protein